MFTFSKVLATKTDRKFFPLDPKPSFYVSFKLFVTPINAQWAIFYTVKLFVSGEELKEKEGSGRKKNSIDWREIG